MQPYVFLNTLFVGFFAFAAIHYFLMWWMSRSERLLLYFSAHCLSFSGYILSLLWIAAARDPKAFLVGIDGRIAFGMAATVTTVWIVQLLTGIQARRYTWFVTISGGVIVFIHLFIFPLGGEVQEIYRAPLPWGEVVTVGCDAKRGWWIGPIYALAVSADLFAVFAGWRLGRRDKIGALLIFVASGGSMAAAVAGLFVDLLHSRLPYIGDLPYGTWVILIGIQISREYRRRSDALRESEERYRMLVDNQTEFVVKWLPDGTRLFANESYKRYFGLPDQECVGTSFLPLVAPEYREMIRRKIASLTPERPEAMEEHEVLKPDGGRGWQEWIDRGRFDVQGRLIDLISTGRDVTPRKQSDLALRRSEERYRLLTERAGMMVWEADVKTFCFTYVSDSAEQFLGFPAEEWYRSGFWEAQIHPDDRAAAIESCLSHIRLKINHRFEYRMLRADGRTLWVEDVVNLIVEGDEVVGLRGLLIDITARVEADAALRESRERFRGAFDHAAIGLGIVGIDGRWLKVNQSLCDMLGYEESELLEMDFQAITHAEDLAADLRLVRRTLAGEIDTFRMEKRYLTKSGRIVWALLCVSLVRGNSGEPLYFVSQIEDITERREAERKLLETSRANEELLALLETLHSEAPVGLTFVDSHFPVVRCNRALSEINGIPIERHIGRTVAEVVPELWPTLKPIYEEVRASQTASVDFEVAGITPAVPCGHRHWLTSLYPVRIGDEVIGLGLIVTEITERKRIEQAFASSEARTRAILRAVPDLMIHLDSHETVLDYSAPQPSVDGGCLVGKRLDDVFPTAVAAQFREHSAQTLAGRGPRHFEYQLDSDPRERKSYEARMALCGTGETVTIVRDVTERKQLEERLRHGQKMEAIGRLAGGIAHDFNNIVTVVSIYGKLMLETMSDDDPHRAGAQAILDAADRATGLTRSILAFSRKQLVQPVTVDLNEVVRQAQPLLKQLLVDEIRLTVDLDPQPCYVRIDRHQIDQVLMNLSVNSRDAMRDGGRLTIATRIVAAPGAEKSSCEDAAERRRVELIVTDTGTGIDEADKERIFEPFFTTKPAGRGTGLGLAVVYGIVEQSGGAIRVESRRGVGTAVSIDFPLSLSESSPLPTPNAPLAAASRELILVVDDEEPIRRAVTTILERSGYQVVAAAGCEDALRVFERRKDEIRLLLTDVVLPDGDGRGIAEQITATYGPFPVLLMSGYHDVGDESNRCGRLLEKPFTPETLTEAVRRSLDTAR